MSLRIWMFGLPSKGYERMLDELSSLGFTDIVIGTQDINQVKAAKDRNFKVHGIVVAFRLDEKFKKPEYLAEDPLGRKHIWFNSGCPNNPFIRYRCLKVVEEWVTKYEVDGVILDGIRFASSGSGFNAFTTCFCVHCKDRAKELGFEFERMRKAVFEFSKSIRRAPKLLYKLVKGHYINLFHLLLSYHGLLSWTEFRTECIAEYIKDVRNIIKSVSDSIELGAYVFTPSLAPLVGQCYYRISEYLDLIKPMIYRIGKGVACFNYELYAMANEILRYNPELEEAVVLRFIYDVFSLPKGLPERTIELLENGLSYEILKREVSIARALVPTKGVLHPIIMLCDKRIEKAVELLLQAKVDGVDFFAFKEELIGNIKRAIKVIDKFKVNIL